MLFSSFSCFSNKGVFAKFLSSYLFGNSCSKFRFSHPVTALAVPYLNSIEGKKELFCQELVLRGS